MIEKDELTLLSDECVLLVLRVVCVSEPPVGSQFELQELVPELPLVSHTMRKVKLKQETY